MKQYEHGFRKYIVAASVFCVLSRTLGVLSAYFLGRALDGAVARDIQVLIMLTIYALIVELVAGFFSVLFNHYNLLGANGISQGLSNTLMRKFYSRMVALFHRHDDSYYINILTADIEALRVNRYITLPCEIGYATEAIVALAILMLISPWMCLVSLIMAFLPMGAARIFTKVTQKRVLLRSKATEKYIGVVNEAIQGYETIKSINIPESYFARFESITRSMFKSIYDEKIIQSIAYTAARTLASLSVLTGIAVGGYLVYVDTITVGALLSSIVIFSYVADGIGNYIEERVCRLSAHPIRDKIIKETEISIAPANKKENNTLLEHAPRIEYKNLTFGFNERVLYNSFSYRFEPGRIYAVLGESGSGKSTLYKLLLKYYTGYTGKITVNGIDIQEMTESEIYSLIGVVHQTTFLINASLRNNITLFNESVPDVDALLNKLSLEALAKRVGTAALGDFGDNISGGERQRISIARTLLHNPKILIFDEPTTGLDPDNTQIINDYIFSMDGITRILISHDWTPEYLEKFDGVIRL